MHEATVGMMNRDSKPALEYFGGYDAVRNRLFAILRQVLGEMTGGAIASLEAIGVSILDANSIIGGNIPSSAGALHTIVTALGITIDDVLGEPHIERAEQARLARQISPMTLGMPVSGIGYSLGFDPEPLLPVYLQITAWEELVSKLEQEARGRNI